MADYKPATNKCPICKKDTEEAFRPFCSKRCANADLLKWIKGEYAIPSDEPPSEEDFDPFVGTLQSGKAH
ncbi:hypothetical protein FHS83_002481 [Rhizomicrobium palustre]|uniref:DNA gyrase inhibitor YacG n=1 Tax=Rhizomicrobium palustre TaxID=189966 RepID=A0A846N0R8_9PROT|nr:hypothetical protein [Rhizomicrobium palustre]